MLNETLLLDAAELERDRFCLMLERNFCAFPSFFSLWFGMADEEEAPAYGPDRMMRDEDASFVLVEFGVAVPDPAATPPALVWSFIFF